MREFDSLIKTVRILRSPRGCPWDRAQKIDNYKKYLLEETYELIDEINRNKIATAKEELGDLFLILVVITEFFREKNKFNLKSVLKTINQKLISRHPHVFAKEKLKTKEEVFGYWIKHKAKKKRRETIKDRLPLTAPALFLSDILFREYRHINKKKATDIQKEVSAIISEFIEGLKYLQRKKNKESAILEIIFSICKLASFYHIDLENLLRKKVFKEAERIAYRVI